VDKQFLFGNSVRKGGRGESPEPLSGPGSSANSNALRPGPASDPPVSRLEGIRRGLAANPQLPLLSDEVAYLSYVKYCREVLGLQSPPDIETWQRNSRILFGPHRLTPPNP
jgi:hypothetical protein